MLHFQRTILFAIIVSCSGMIIGCASSQTGDPTTKEAVATSTGDATNKAVSDKGPVGEQPAAAQIETASAQIETAVTAAAEASSVVPEQKASTVQVASIAPATADGRRIWFIKGKSVAIYAEPKDDAKVVGHLAQGDHVLATADGSWATVDQTQYIKLDQLSDKPVGRVRAAKKKWDKSAAHH